MKLGRNNLIVNRTREALKSKAKRKSGYDAMRLISDSSIQGLYPSTSKIFGLGGGFRMHHDESSSAIYMSDLVIAQNVEVGLKLPYDDYTRFHVNVWRECSDVFTRSNMVITQNTTKDTNTSFEKEVVFLFANKQDAEEARAWWDKYRARFHDMNKTCLPKFANGQPLTGSSFHPSSSKPQDT